MARERAQQERAVRLAWAATSGAGGPAAPASAGELVEQLGDRILVQLVNVDGMLHAVVVRDGRWRTVEVGPAGGWRTRRWIARCTASAARRVVGPSTSRRSRSGWKPPCSDQWLGCCRADRAVVISPPAAFLGAPWGLLPSLQRPAGRADPVGHRVGAGAQGGLPVPAGRLRGRSRPAHGRRRGRDGRRPVRRTRPASPSDDATVPRALAVLEGAGLAHIAAHGFFRCGEPDVLQPATSPTARSPSTTSTGSRTRRTGSCSPPVDPAWSPPSAVRTSSASRRRC